MPEWRKVTKLVFRCATNGGYTYPHFHNKKRALVKNAFVYLYSRRQIVKVTSSTRSMTAMCRIIYIFFLWNVAVQADAASVADIPKLRPARIVNGEEVRDGTWYWPIDFTTGSYSIHRSSLDCRGGGMANLFAVIGGMVKGW